MSNQSGSRELQGMDWRDLFRRLFRAIFRNWKLKLTSLLVAIAVWGGLISEDATLTREKLFSDVQVTVSGMETLQRNGLVVVSGLEDLKPISMRADVPQKAYDNAAPVHYSARVDVSRITATGEQIIPIQTSNSLAYGSVSWLSVSEVKVHVEEYITRRRVPVVLEQAGVLPEGYYAAAASVDPVNVIVSGPRSQVEKLDRIQASYNLGLINPQQGLQYVAVPFRLLASDGSEIGKSMISVTSENVLLDTLLVEQQVYPLKAGEINLSGIIKGEPAEGYQVNAVTADPPSVMLAGRPEDIDGIRMLDLSVSIDVSGHRDTLIRAVKVERPDGVVYMSENAVYVTVEILPVPPASGKEQ